MKAKYDVSRVRKLMISSAPARKDTKLAILDYFKNSQLYELYGSSEAGWVTLLRPDEQINHLGSVGREWTGSGPVKILDPDGSEVPDGEVGELFSCTPYTFDGYLNDPVKTQGVDPRRRLLQRRRHGAPGRARLHLPRRPQEQHDHQRRREHLPERDREHPRAAIRA